MNRIRTFVTATLLALGSAAGAADLVIAHVGPFTGPLSQSAEGNYVGAKAYIDRVNAEGGIGGRTLRYVREDDRYQPEETERLLQQVAQRDRPVAFVNLMGSLTMQRLLSLGTLEKLAIPVIGTTPGSEAFRNPGSPWLFHLQAGDRAQVGKLLAQFSTMGLGEVGVVYQDNPFGKSALAHAEELAPKSKVGLAAKVGLANGADDARAAHAELRRAKAQAYLVLLAPNSAAAFIRDARAAGDPTPIYTLSYAGIDLLREVAGVEKLSGVGLAQVLPNPAAPTTGLVRSYLADMARFAPADTPPSSLSLTGYLAARVAVEALRRAGANPAPATVAAALGGLQGLDLGGYLIDFSAGNRVGSRYVEISVIDRAGKIRY